MLEPFLSCTHLSAEQPCLISMHKGNPFFSLLGGLFKTSLSIQFRDCHKYPTSGLRWNRGDVDGVSALLLFSALPPAYEMLSFLDWPILLCYSWPKQHMRIDKRYGSKPNIRVLTAYQMLSFLRWPILLCFFLSKTQENCVSFSLRGEIFLYYRKCWPCREPTYATFLKGLYYYVIVDQYNILEYPKDMGINPAL